MHITFALDALMRTEYLENVGTDEDVTLKLI
jgi:hypothetical protein